MSRDTTLRQNVVNQVIASIEGKHITSPLPSQSVLAELFNVSRTTIRHVLAELVDKGLLMQQEGLFLLEREPLAADKYSDLIEHENIQYEKVEQIFFQLINDQQLKGGQVFSDLHLAKLARVKPAVAREFLLRFMHYGLIKNISRGVWQMLVIEQTYAENLFDFRRLLEIHAIEELLSQPKDSLLYFRSKELLLSHRELEENINLGYHAFSELDYKFHQLILSAVYNPFFIQSFDLISVIFHFHYQWDDDDLKQRNHVAVKEHINILESLVNKDRKGAIDALIIHLNTAKQTMIDSINRSSNKKQIKNR